MNTRNTLILLTLASALLWVSGLRAQTQMLDQVVAIVDDDVIMASELKERVAGITQNLKSRGIQLPPEDELIRETLDRLILESIQLQKGMRAGVRISDAQLDGAMQNIAAQNRLTLEQFRTAVEQQGQSYNELREQVRREMIIQRVQAGNVNQRIQITPKEVDNFLATEDGRKLTQTEYDLLHALLSVPADASPAQVAAAKDYVDKVYRQIRDGEPFERAVSRTSGIYGFSGGDLGWRSAADLPSLFAGVAPGLKKGETAAPIRSDSGFHLIHMKDRRGGEAIVEQTRVRHILIKPSEIMTDEQARDLALELRARIEAGEDFGELAKKYSEDIGSAAEGGELGWTNPGQMVPEFEKAMNATAVGQLSQPVRSQFGWHILEVEERREQDLTREAVRAKAADYLHQRKYQEELDAWLQQIRDEAYVDIK